MAHAPHPDARFTSSSISGNIGVLSSGMFAGAENFTITGRPVLNNISYATPTVPSDYRMLPLGDIDLQLEICLKPNTGIVSRRPRPGERRVYSAKVNKQRVTVAMYQGGGAAEEWQTCMSEYRMLRHPTILQIYGAASSDGLHAIVFHDDLMPMEYCLDLYRHSPCLMVYIHGYCAREFEVARRYLDPLLQISTYPSDCTMWIRGSTGRLCVDLVPPDEPSVFPLTGGRHLSDLPGLLTIGAARMEAMAIDALTLEDYHQICSWALGHTCCIGIPAGVTVNLGAVISRIQSNYLGEIASLVDHVEVHVENWFSCGNAQSTFLENGWRRFSARDAFGRTFVVPCSNWSWSPWLSQANHIFNRCHITSNFKDWAVIFGVRFTVTISELQKTFHAVDSCFSAPRQTSSRAHAPFTGRPTQHAGRSIHQASSF
ncbi:hypothetical protein DFH06DRAFT_464358 [Mycena polygramma]|nr:hypothetical protein DFH06DRAFT_464358 [Mycena polygramma]